jgi:hypothetical protein
MPKRTNSTSTTRNESENCKIRKYALKLDKFESSSLINENKLLKEQMI